MCKFIGLKRQLTRIARCVLKTEGGGVAIYVALVSAVMIGFGALFRSSDFVRNETELVLVVTPYIVKPVSADQIVLPTDKFLPPSEKDFFLLGKIRQDMVNVAPTSGPGGQIGGIAGAHGHIVE